MQVIVAGRLDRSALAKAHIENMFGHPGQKGGMELLEAGRMQAESFGAKFEDGDIIHAGKKGDAFLARNENGLEIGAKAVIIAIGVKRKTLKLPRADEFLGKGLSYCADCDARFFKNRDVVVVGDESAAASGALVLKKYAKNVHLVSERLKVSGSMMEELKSSGIIILDGRKVTAIEGTDMLEGVSIDDGSRLKANGLFIELGSKGAMELATLLAVIPDEKGYIPVDRRMGAGAPGVFACGDITGPPLQLAKAVGEGCTAGISAAEYVKAAGTAGGSAEKTETY